MLTQTEADTLRTRAASTLAGKIASKHAPEIDTIRLERTLRSKGEARLCMANSGVFVEAEVTCAVNGEGTDIFSITRSYVNAFDNLSDAMAVAAEMYMEPDGEFNGAEFRFYDKHGNRIGP